MTEKLYESDGLLSVFSATVLECAPEKNGFSVRLDRTAFFPEGGGQKADVGTLGGVNVTDVHVKDGDIRHYTDAPLAVGSTVEGTVNMEVRLPRMQNHTGEHILSGILHSLYGMENVGFHLGDNDVTIDTSGPLKREELHRAELLANRIVMENRPVSCTIPSKEELNAMTYRSKKELEGDVRIVAIDGVDCCACCAPHMPTTGRVGLIKIFDAIHYKGGMRIHLLCGLWAVEQAEAQYLAVAQSAAALSVKQMQLPEAVNRISSDLGALSGENRTLKKLVAASAAEKEPFREGNLVLYLPLLDMDGLREAALLGREKCSGVCFVYSGENAPHAYAAASNATPMRAFSKEMNAKLNGRGGGSDELVSGSMNAGSDEINTYFG